MRLDVEPAIDVDRVSLEVRGDHVPSISLWPKATPTPLPWETVTAPPIETMPELSVRGDGDGGRAVVGVDLGD